MTEDGGRMDEYDLMFGALQPRIDPSMGDPVFFSTWDYSQEQTTQS
jgi:hypothetical protein